MDHNSDEHVLLRVERARVETEAATSDGEVATREDLFEEFADGVSQNLSAESVEGDGRVTSGEEGVDTSADDSENAADEPCTEGIDRDGRVIKVVNDSANLDVAVRYWNSKVANSKVAKGW